MCNHYERGHETLRGRSAKNRSMTPNLSCESLNISETYENDLDLRIRHNFQKTILESVPSLDPVVRFKKKRPQGG